MKHEKEYECLTLLKVGDEMDSMSKYGDPRTAFNVIRYTKPNQTKPKLT